jgi:hypothetical protein
MTKYVIALLPPEIISEIEAIYYDTTICLGNPVIRV